MSGSFHSFFVASGMRANAFLPVGCSDRADRLARVAAASTRRTAPELIDLLLAQNRAWGASGACLASLEALARPGTVVVATGQQVGLFLGPLYTLYKAATAIAVARELTRETGTTCVPLFWLQTEDHDFAEIASTWVPRDREPPLKLTVPDDPAFERRSVANRTLGPQVQGTLDELARILGDRPHGDQVIALLRTHYRPGAFVVDAFAGALTSLLAEDGLVVFNPRHPTVSKLGASVFRTALLESKRIEETLAGRRIELEHAGFSEQVPVRTGASLVCFHQEDAQGPRYRLGCDGENFRLLGADGKLSRPEAVECLERDPLRFSTTALLRPMFQDTLFPTAAYVGGPAEVDYFAQLTPLYPLFGREPPLVVPRNHFRLVPRRVKAALEQTGLSPADLDQSHEAILQMVARRLEANGDGGPPGPGWATEVERRLDQLLAGDSRLEPQLRRAADRTRATLRRALERFGTKYQRALLEREQTVSNRVARLESWLRPDGKPQERVFGFAAFAAETGVQAFVQAVRNAARPFDPSIREIELG